ncbi:MAG: hypothetical protein H7Y61_15510, partial [Rhizobiales bacterium]|nr:hypothetical protein [Rhizobacter sp.]
MTTTLKQFKPAPRASRLRGLSVFAVVALALAAGCAHAPSDGSRPPAAVVSPWAAPTATLRWNEYGADLIAKNQAGQVGAARTFAYLNLAIHNGIVGAKAQGRKPEGAAAGAAAAVLAFAFSKDEASINARLAQETAALGTATRADFAAGVEAGRTAAAEVIASARGDRLSQPWTGS